MPQHLGERNKVKAEAGARAVAIRAAMLVATSEADVDRLAAELKEALRDKDSHLALPDDQFSCAWHLQGQNHAAFRSKKRVVYQISARYEYDDEGEPVKEDRFQRPMYFVACPGCETAFALGEHLTE